jgi:hypothetical protein
MNNELRKNVRLNWLDSLFEFSHHEFQNKVWLKAEFEDYVSNYSEAICSYFDDLNMNDGFDWFMSEGFATQEEFSLFDAVHRQLKEYAEHPEKQNLMDIDILEDIEWIELTKNAKISWDKLKAIIKDKSELYHMLDLENKYLIDK